MSQSEEPGKVLVLCPTESFLAKSLISKIESSGVLTLFSHGDIREIEKQRPRIELMVVFLDQELLTKTDTLVYLKDMASDLDRRFIFIGDADELELIQKAMPDNLVLSSFKRPLVMDDLIKCILDYMAENSGENRKKTILIVDDDITYMRTVYEWLKESYHVGMAVNGVQAISFLARNKADLVLLDYEMPIADGPQVMQMLRNDSETGQIPVMFLTGHSDKKSVLSVVDLKPADYLLKTIDRQTLLKKLDTYFKEHALNGVTLG